MTTSSKPFNELFDLGRHSSLFSLISQPNFDHTKIGEEQIRYIFEICDALWLRHEDPEAPHVGLTSGMCSDGFVDVLRVLRYTQFCQLFAKMLADKFKEYSQHYARELGQPFWSWSDADWVIGSDHAGATISYAVAAELQAQHDFTEKGPNKTQAWKRFAIEPEESVLQVEELITTTGTLQAVREGIIAGNPNPVKFLPVALTLIHRSAQYEFEGGPILYLAHFDIRTWDSPDVCPLCLGGKSKRITEPKKHWAELTGQN